VPFARAVRLVLVREPAERPVHGRYLARVAVHHAPGQQRDTDPVDDDVVVALVPPHPVVGQPQQHVGEQRPGREVHAPRPVGVCPRQRGRLRVRLGAQVHHRHIDGRRRHHDMGRLTGEADVQALGLPQRCPDRRREPADVDRPPDVEVHGDVEGRAVGLDLLCVPNSGLCPGQPEGAHALSSSGTNWSSA
jgi:hypothetical protein